LYAALADGPTEPRALRGLVLGVTGVGLVTPAVGVEVFAMPVAIDLARAVWRDGSLPRWAGVSIAVGLSLWLPLLPRSVRIVDGFMIGLGGVWLAWGIWRKGMGEADQEGSLEPYPR